MATLRITETAISKRSGDLIGRSRLVDASYEVYVEEMERDAEKARTARKARKARATLRRRVMA